MAVVKTSAGKWLTIGPIIAFSCLGLVLFTIAGMIVLSLIPVYLSKNNSSVGTDRSDRYNAQIRLTNNGVVSIGDTLDTSARTLIANKITNTIAQIPEIGSGFSVDIHSAQVLGGTPTRRQISPIYANIVFQFVFKRNLCPNKSCLNGILALCRQIFKTLIITIPNPWTTTDNTVINDVTLISTFWSRLSSYKANHNDAFGIQNTGLPDGCQVEQAHVLHRNGERLPSEDEFQLMSTFATQVTALKGTFTGPLSYLNAWSLQLASGGLLAEGVSNEFTSGTSFWTNYGRLLFNAAPNQPFYNGTGFNKPVLRSPDTDYLIESTESWAKGFFYILNSPESQYTLVTIPTSKGNNTLTSYTSCTNYDTSSYGLDGLPDTYIDLLPTFLQSAVDRLSTYAPSYGNFSATDVFTLQLLCIYEYYAFDNSDACSLFTVVEWQGFEYILDILGYYGYSFGQPAGRALGLGYLEELLARLNNQYITTSSSSVNSTLDSSSTTFPLNETFFMDMTDGSTIVSFLTALSLDYFRQSRPIQSSIPTSRTFRLGQIAPFSGHLITEKIGCTQPNPTATNSNSTIYTKGQNGYSVASATNKFIRIRLNNGILPLSTIRGGLCSDRTDGLCSLSNFIQSQSNASVEANYQFVCFGSYTYDPNIFNQDGTYFI